MSYLMCVVSLTGDGELAFGIHDVHVGDVEEAVLAGGLEVLFGGRAPSFVGGVAFDDGSVNLLDEVLDQRGLEEVVSAGLSGADLDGHATFGGAAEGLIDAHEGLGGDFGGHVDHGLLRFGSLAGTGCRQPQHHRK